MSFTKRDDHWQFAVDVGGTFTDCISRDAHGNQQWAKVLSSSITKGSVDKVVDSVRLSDPARCGDGPDFWRGYRLELFGESGQSLLTGEVQTFDDENGIFRLKHPLDSSGSLERFSGPLQYQLRSDESAPLLVIRKLLGMGIHQPLPPISVRLGTTRGTNALLTRSGASTALITTRGFGDVLAIADQTRPELFKLAVEKPSCLYQQVVEIDERILANGSVRLAPDANAVERQLRTLRETGIESVAICFLHGYKYPVHELLVGELAHEMGFSEISLSSEVAPLIKIVPRGETTVLDAYLNPILRQYLLDLTKKLHPDSRLRLMTSAGGLVPSGRFGGKESILSGPAGGVVGFSHVARRSGFTKSIGFDMGGTSTDVARYDGEFERS